MGIRAERVFDVFGACERWWMGWDGMCGYWVSRGLERGDVDRGRESEGRGGFGSDARARDAARRARFEE